MSGWTKPSGGCGRRTSTRARRGRLGCRLLVQLGERGGLARVGVVAEDRDRLCEPRRLRRKAGKAKRDGARAGPCLELAETGHVGCGRGQALGGDRVQRARARAADCRPSLPGRRRRRRRRRRATGLAHEPAGSRGVPAEGSRPERRSASGSETICPMRGILSRLARPETDDHARGTAPPCAAGGRPSQRSEGRSHQCRSSTASRAAGGRRRSPSASRGRGASPATRPPRPRRRAGRDRRAASRARPRRRAARPARRRAAGRGTARRAGARPRRRMRARALSRAPASTCIPAR